MSSEAPTQPESQGLFDLGVLPTNSRIFPTEEEAMFAIREFAMGHGYGISTAKSSFYCGQKIIIYLQCDRSRPYKPKKAPTIRRGGTKSTNCPFRMALRRQKHPEKEGKFHWLVTVTNGHDRHNHPTQPISTHSTHRKATIQQHADQISIQIRRGISSRQIIRNIKAPWLSPRDIYNFRATLNKNERTRVVFRIEENNRQSTQENDDIVVENRNTEQEIEIDDQQMIDQQIHYEMSLAEIATEITANFGDRNHGKYKGIPSQMTNVMQF
ncbi:hypothetical protein N7495_001015 [Penicillium taxi]|uniref:uncharacterized protein n=1 Tax=Penicillium taxi TaxID=168475 RepID=UPI002545AF93|nr:uncharacterized protein N7495_001015 [Penicillium taxi]KAJ5908333.1 hypothetical protein N7495_001015 [Penicillium taxi]